MIMVVSLGSCTRRVNQYLGCSMKSQPLTETELDQLSAVLPRFGDERSMNLEQLDGFLLL
jgi:hypothetical protein